MTVLCVTGKKTPGDAFSRLQHISRNGEIDRITEQVLCRISSDGGHRLASASPLCIYGPTGSGKTHIAHATANAMLIASCMPAIIDGLTAALRSRLIGGAMLPLAWPDATIKKLFIQRRINGLAMNVDDAVCELLASRLNSIPEIQGALSTLFRHLALQ